MEVLSVAKIIVQKYDVSAISVLVTYKILEL
jgi:hypothetical protein